MKRLILSFMLALVCSASGVLAQSDRPELVWQAFSYTSQELARPTPAWSFGHYPRGSVAHNMHATPSLDEALAHMFYPKGTAIALGFQTKQLSLGVIAPVMVAPGLAQPSRGAPTMHFPDYRRGPDPRDPIVQLVVATRFNPGAPDFNPSGMTWTIAFGGSGPQGGPNIGVGFRYRIELPIRFEF